MAVTAYSTPYELKRFTSKFKSLTPEFIQILGRCYLIKNRLVTILVSFYNS